MPPECLLTFGLVTHAPFSPIDEAVSGEKWDVYSLGILFAFIFTGRRPYPGLMHSQIMRQVVEKELRLTLTLTLNPKP